MRSRFARARTLSVGLLLLAVAGLLSTALAAGTITLGLLAPMTGSRSDLGKGMEQGAQLALDEINAAGGVLGHKVVLKVQDSAADPADAVPGAQALINVYHVAAIIGPTAITDGVVLPLVDKANIPNLMFGGGGEFDKATDPHFFRMSPSDSEQGDAMAVYAHSKGWDKIALAFGSSGGSQSLIPPIKAAAKKLGMTIVANVTLTAGQSSYRSEIERIFQHHPQAVIAQFNNTTAGVLFGEVQQMGFQKTPWVGSNLWFTSTFVKSVGASAASGPIYVTNSSSTGMLGAKKFMALLKQKLGMTTPANGMEFMYDAAMTWALGADEAGSIKMPAVRKGILSIARPPGQAVGDYATGLKLIKAGKAINWQGSASTDDFDKYDNVYGPFAILHYSSGQWGTTVTMSPQQIQNALK